MAVHKSHDLNRGVLLEIRYTNAVPSATWFQLLVSRQTGKLRTGPTRRVSESIGVQSLSNQQRTIVERLVPTPELASHQGRFPTDLPLLRTNQR